MDLNCDLGEGTGNDHMLMPYISSCSIACGGHIGDTLTIQQALLEAKKHGVKVGAHPSYPDRKNFGRHSLALPTKTFQDSIRSQLAHFKKVLTAVEVPWNHIKPHGALYNDMANNQTLTNEFIAVVLDFPEVKSIYCMAGQPLVSWIKDFGLIPIEEAFGDRAYKSDGRLLSRTLPKAVFNHFEQVEKQVKNLQSGYVYSQLGDKIPLHAQTVCIHSDTPQAATFVKQLHHSVIKQDHV